MVDRDEPVRQRAGKAAQQVAGEAAARLRGRNHLRCGWVAVSGKHSRPSGVWRRVGGGLSRCPETLSAGWACRAAYGGPALM